MSFARFYGHFAAAYGTFWLILLLVAVVSQSHVDAGGFGMFGFPLIALVYAVIRTTTTARETDEVQQLRERVARLEGALEEAHGGAGGF